MGSIRGLRKAGRVVPAILLCLIGGCAPRRPNLPAPPISSRVDAPAPPRRDIAVLFNNAPGYAEVAAELKSLLPERIYRLTMVDVDAEDSDSRLGTLRGKPGLFVVAIGLPAARMARDRLNAPIVFSQVFNYQELFVQGRAIRGVTAMPPLALHARNWKKLDPGLQQIGLIVSSRHADLVREAEDAAAAAGVKIRHELSDSDRETLYVFKRLVPQIDGLWLVPDDRILSPGVLREMLGYAASHGVQVCVFSDTLLGWGALMSASPSSRDIARTVRRVLEHMIAGNADTVPALTPLSEVVVRVNERVAGRLGLTSWRGSWIVRGDK